MAQHLYIITGASRGMGLAMAEQLLSAEHMLLCISRHRNQALTSRADTLGCPLEQWPMDLEHGVEAAAQLAQWLESRAAGSFASATLINNAGVLPQIAPLSASDPRDLAPVSYTHLRAHETRHDIVCRLLLEKKKNTHTVRFLKILSCKKIQKLTQ